MRISSVKIAGFRGVKENVELSLPSGFIVISGRNGTGKTSICDAIEYGLTGSIRVNYEHKEKGESISDYLWWRGEGDSSAKYVNVTFLDRNDKEITITRTPQGQDMQDEDLKKYLCDQEIAEIDSLTQICRSLIIRDEEITQLSLELSESERFEFVRSALGTIDFSDIKKRAEKVLLYFKEATTKFENQYNEIRTRITGQTIDLSESKSETLRYKDLDSAERSIKDILQLEVSDRLVLLENARSTISELRYKVDNLVRIIRRFEEVENRIAEIETLQYKEDVEKLQNQKMDFEKQLKEMENELLLLDKKIQKQRIEQPRLSSLAELHEHGKLIGLEDGHCPLCNSRLSEQDFRKHLSVIEQNLKTSSEISSSSIQNRTKLIKEKDSLLQDVESTTQKLAEASSAKSIIERELSELRDNAIQNGLEISVEEEFTSEKLSACIEEGRRKIRGLENSITTLESSRINERIIRLEQDINLSKLESEKLEKQIGIVRYGESKAKAAIDIIKRLSGEIVDERLAELTPLLAELYKRLRPHVNWQEINYHMRGDVRHFLSFKIGDELNPSFIFSSGQSRAAGLAFLLAIHLSRRWCLLDTLVLDDPVQHIDDFRALNLVEVLSAIRKSGRQIICTVEDEALADLLCRKLRATENNEGCHIKMDYHVNKGAFVSSFERIRPMSSQILLSA